MEDDPGWGSWRKMVFALVLPQVAVRRAAKERDALLALRTVFVGCTSALVLFGVVVLFIPPAGPETDVGLAITVLIALGLLPLTLVRVVPRPLRSLGCGESLVASLRLSTPPPPR